MIGSIRNSQIINDYVKFSGEDMPDLVNKLLISGELIRHEFNQYSNKFEFYKNSSTYIYDILLRSLSKDSLISKLNLFSPYLFKNIFNKEYKNFADFGAGSGVMCEIVKNIRPDMNVNYIDIQSMSSNFATWRFHKNKINVNTLIIEQEDFNLPSTYDAIFIDAVIENLEDSHQVRYIKKLPQYISKNGMLSMLIDLEGKNEVTPMHYNVDIVLLHSILEECDMHCVYGRNTFSSIWKKNK